MNMDRIEFEPEELQVAAEWHGGQASMLYAISSTGALSRGVERCRPHVDCDACGARGWVSPSEPCGTCHGAMMTDAQWLVYLASKLADEALAAADDACERRYKVEVDPDDDILDLDDDVEHLDGIAAKCREAIALLTGSAS
jgi:hypothetical protein